MVNKEEPNYLVFSPDLDRFVEIKKLKKPQFDPFFAELRTLAKGKKFAVGDYRAHLVKHFIVNIDTVIAEVLDEIDSPKERKAIISELVMSLANGVEQVYPFLGIQSVSEALNSQLDSLTGSKLDSETTKFNTLKSISGLRKSIGDHIIGQELAVDEMIKSIKLKAAGLNSFTTHFFIGPTGVGKTELSKVLAQEYLGSRKKLIKINCGEYSSSHEYAKLLGSPPGYVGHQEKGFLSEKAAESSEWVILFDEIEKAHPKMHNVLLNLLDEGTLTDAQGTLLDFSNSVIIMTSNVGVREFVGKTSVGFYGEEANTYENSKDRVEASFKEEFSPEFINRIQSVIYFEQLTETNAKDITKILLKDYPIVNGIKLVNHIVKESFSLDYGARNLKRFILGSVAPLLADAMLTHGKGETFKATFNSSGALTGFSPKKTTNNETLLGVSALL